MPYSPLSSTHHSESVCSSVRPTGSHSSFSVSHDRRVHDPSRHGEHVIGAHSPRSVESTETPHLDGEEKALYNGRCTGSSASQLRHPWEDSNGDTHRYAVPGLLNHSSCFRMLEHVRENEDGHVIEKGVVHGTATYGVSPILPLRSSTREGETACCDVRSTCAIAGPASPVIVGDTRDFWGPSSSFPSAATSPSLTTPQRMDGAFAGAHGSAAQPPDSGARYSKDSPLTFPTEEMEAALQLYMERGGTYTSEVSSAPQALPWCPTTSAHASPASSVADHPGKSTTETTEQPLTDLAVWLSTVAAEKAAAVGVAEKDEQAGAACPSVATRLTSAGVLHTARGRRNTDEENSATTMHSSNLSERSTPAPLDRTAEKRRSLGDCSSDVAATGGPAADSAVVDHGAGCGSWGSLGVASEVRNRSQFLGNESNDSLLREISASGHHVSTDSKLVYGDAHNDPTKRVLRVEGSPSVPRLTPHHRSGAAQHTPQQQQPQQQPVPGFISNTGALRNSLLYSSVSPMQLSLHNNRRSHVTAAMPSPVSSPAVASEDARKIANHPAASTFAAASTETSGTHAIFQLCLRTPSSMTSRTMRVSDWHALLDQLRQDGRYKLPPQPILDDVARTIAHTMHSAGHSGGLSLSDFARVIQRQLKEVRVDMTSPLPRDGTADDGTTTGQGVALYFPQHPRYTVTVPSSAAVLSPPSSLPSRSRSRCRSQTKLSPVIDGGQWRVLPTWCMALAGLFPLEMSKVCPVPVVRYLRSIGLIRAVLEAIMQRLQIEVEAIPECVAPVSSADSNQTQNPSEGATVESFSLLPSREASGGIQSASKLLALSGASAVARPASAAVVTEKAVDGSGDKNETWPEQPIWGSAAAGSHRRRAQLCRRAASANMVMAPLERAGDDGAVAACNLQGVSNRNGGLKAGANASVSSDTLKSHYLDQRPLDEISISIVARAKARRLMDMLRRNTVPMNRYECFARVEQKDEPVQKALCFVSREELKTTFSDSGEDSEEDSDAMPDMVAALTYHPEGEMVASRGGAIAKGGCGIDVDQTHSSRPPPPLSHTSAPNVLPTVIMSAMRASMCIGGRASSTPASRVTSAGSAVRPPTSVPCMFRMSGVLCTALPRKQEEALVSRLSKPVCDPAAMSLRLTSASNDHTACHAADTTAAVGASDSIFVNAKVIEDHPTRLAPARPPSGPVPQQHYRPHPHPTDHELPNDAVLPSGRDPPSRKDFRPPRSRPASSRTDRGYASVYPARQHHASSLVSSDTGSGGTCTSQLTERRNRGFLFFEVPSFLATAPLSSSAAAAAAVRLIDGGARSALSSGVAIPPQPPAPHRQVGHHVASSDAHRGTSRAAGSAALLYAKENVKSAGGRRAGSASKNLVLKPARRGLGYRSSVPQHSSDAPLHGRSTVDARVVEDRGRTKATDTAAAAHPPAASSQPHISLYERRLCRQLQLAYANEHTCHRIN
ncbi:hypothetical protein, conserved [Leishmania tarentolae]|uniref:Uncharacterized protein n=1 Tax=Leishmania tarentolae TaxID=5689 RepID=A0A640KGM2_LEITA|nr:hypothetical protein, conserved [Leishmania tarentolae]